MKKHLTRAEEFQMLKLVMDKFLWVGVFVMMYGFYRLINATAFSWYNLAILFAGAMILGIFTVILIREYEFIK
jgi:hypothetical protein